MKITGIVLGGVALAIIGAGALNSSALAQQALTGTVTQIDRISGTIAIRQTQEGTVGANTGGAAEKFKAKDAAMLEAVHAGDRVSFTAIEGGGSKTLTRIDKQ